MAVRFVVAATVAAASAAPLAYAQPYSPEEDPTPKHIKARRGMTGSLELGGGYLSNEYASNGAFGFAFDIGHWLTSYTALSGRFSMQMTGEDTDIVGAVLVGPSVQHWLGKHMWIGGGVGYGGAVRDNADDESRNAGAPGFGADFRVGLASGPAWGSELSTYSVVHISLDVAVAGLSNGASFSALLLAGWNLL